MNIEKVLCANIAVPSNDGSFHPGPDTNIIRSGNFSIDYIRVWNNQRTENIKNVPVYSGTSCSKDITKSQLKSKTRFLYGQKSIHENEGIIVSLFEKSPNTFCLTTLGKEIPLNSKIEIFNENGKTIYTNNLKYGEITINLNDYEGQKFALKINCFNKTVNHQLSKRVLTYR